MMVVTFKWSEKVEVVICVWDSNRAQYLFLLTQYHTRSIRFF